LWELVAVAPTEEKVGILEEGKSDCDDINVMQYLYLNSILYIFHAVNVYR
jgi:hypothetical protein